jgi:hypothetical protein
MRPASIGATSADSVACETVVPPPVVVDNTNPTVDERAPIIELARRYGAAVLGYVFELHLGACLDATYAAPAGGECRTGLFTSPSAGSGR